MIRLPSDPDGRYWAISRADDAAAKEIPLVTLVSADDEGRLDVLGTGFVIYGHKETAICAGAAHSFDEPKRRKLARSGHRYLNVPPDFLPKGSTLFDPSEVHALVVSGGQPFTCTISGYNSIDNYDVAVFGLLEPNGQDVFKSKFALDLAVPQVGDEVATFVSSIELHQLEPGSAKIGHDIHLRHGVVTDVAWDVQGPMRLGGQSFIVRTTIPIPGGMSGSPLLWKSNEGSSVAAWGVVSSDRSEPDAMSNFHKPGDSTASMLWPAMGLFLPVKEQSKATDSHTLMGELLKRGIFDNRSTQIDLEVKGSEKGINIHYRDTRNETPFEFRLDTTGHKLLSKPIE